MHPDFERDNNGENCVYYSQIFMVIELLWHTKAVNHSASCFQLATSTSYDKIHLTNWRRTYQLAMSLACRSLFLCLVTVNTRPVELGLGSVGLPVSVRVRLGLVLDRVNT